MTTGISSEYIDQLWETTCVAVPVNGTVSRRPSFFVPLLLASVADLPALQTSLNELSAELAFASELAPVAAPTIDAMQTWAAAAFDLCDSGAIRAALNTLLAEFNEPPSSLNVLELLADLAQNAIAQSNGIEANATWALIPMTPPENLQLVIPALVQVANALASMIVDVDTLAKVVNNGNVIDVTTAESASTSAASVAAAILAWVNANAGGPPVAIVAGPFSNLQAWRVAQGIP